MKQKNRFTSLRWHHLWLSVLLLSSFAVQALTVQRGPYLQNTQPGKVVVRWRTDTASDSVVRYGTSPTSLNLTATVSTSVTEHSVTVTGLAADQKYFYSVGSSTATHAGGTADYWFRAAPTEGTHNRDYRIWVLGDAGTANSDQNAVRDAYYALDNVDTDLILMLGDNAYNSGTDSETTNAVFKPYIDILRNTPLYSTRGNHEADANVYYNAFTFPTAGEAGGVASGTEAYYSFNFGDVHFVCLDSYGSTMTAGSPQYQWLERDLAANTKKWVIAFWHHPPYSITNGHNSDSESGMKLLRENAVPILERYGVDLQLGGHNHSYNRSYYINGHYGTSSTWNAATHRKQAGDGKVTPYNKDQAQGAVYVMSGSAGKVGYSIDTHPANVSHLYELGSFVIDVKGDRLTGRFLSPNGSTRDEFTIIKSGVTNQTPVANFAFAATQLNVQFTDSSSDSDGAVVSWLWNFGDGSSATSQHPSHAYAQAGTYNVQLTVTDNQGASHSVTKAVTVTAGSNTPPVANFSFVATQLSVQFTDGSSDSDGTIASWAWDFGDGATASTQNATRNYASAGTYSVKLTVTDNGGATHSVTKSVTVNTSSGGDIEPNDSRSQANRVTTSGTIVNGLMNLSSDKDFFRVDLPPGKTLTATLTPNANSDYDLYAYNSSGSLIAKSERSSGKVDVVSVKNTSSSSTTVRYIEVRYYSGASGATGTYTLQLTW